MVNRKTFSSAVVLYLPDALEQATLVESRLRNYGIAFTLVDGSNADDVSQIGTEALVFFLASDGLIDERNVIVKLQEIYALDVEGKTSSLVAIEGGAFKKLGSMFRLLYPMSIQDISREDTEYVLSPLRRVLKENGFQIQNKEEGVEGKSVYSAK